MLMLSSGYKEEVLKSKQIFIHCIAWIGTTVVFVPLLVGSYDSEEEDIPYAMLGPVHLSAH
jgi:protein tyrosine phosphatase